MLIIFNLILIFLVKLAQLMDHQQNDTIHWFAQVGDDRDSASGIPGSITPSSLHVDHLTLRYVN